MKQHYKFNYTHVCVVISVILLLLLIAVPLGVKYIDRNDINLPLSPNFNDTSLEFIIKYDQKTGYYSLDNAINSYDSHYIASSSFPLDQYLNKKVRIQGSFVWTKQPLAYPGYSPVPYKNDIAGVKITNIIQVK